MYTYFEKNNIVDVEFCKKLITLEDIVYFRWFALVSEERTLKNKLLCSLVSQCVNEFFIYLNYKNSVNKYMCEC